MSLDRLFQRMFGDEEPSAPGTGWVSGVLSVVAGLLALGGVLCFRFPEQLTTPALWAHYPVALLRSVVLGLLVLAFAFATRSLLRRRRKVLGLTGALLASLALLLGGPGTPLPQQLQPGFGLGLDWFLLNLLLLAVIFVPLERALPHRPEQLVFRPGWTIDGLHFLVSHLGVQLFSAVLLAPALWLSSVGVAGDSSRVAALPLAVQLPLVLLVADSAQYAAHRAFHRVPFLWRFHAVHHSSAQLDWLAGSRLHLVDALAVRALVLLALRLVGFSDAALTLYLLFVGLHAVWIHSNFGARLRWLEPFLVTPRYHHFHHADEPEAVDKNFAAHLPFLDVLFGTRFLPESRWPRAYGVSSGEPVPEGYLQQWLYPFRRPRPPTLRH